MNDYTFTTRLLARTPLFSFTILETSFLTILKNQQFQTALFLASPSLFYELEKKQFNYEALSERQKQTVKKYTNRAAFRSTPFGLFSSVSVAEWTEGESDELILKKPRSYTSFDFAILQELWERYCSREPAAVCLRTNPSLYFTKVDFRFFRRAVRDNQSSFSMVSVEKNNSLRSLLQYCRKARHCHDIFDFLCQRNVDPEIAARFIENLRNEQILIEDVAPNLTGPDYFTKLSASLPQDRFIQSCKEGLSTLNGAISGSANAVCSLSKLMDHELKKSACTNYFYCISERETIEGGVHKRHQLAIQQGLYCLQRLSAPFYSSDLQAFKKAFVQKYEASEVPLLEAMDAQFGIGYGRFEQLRVNYGFSSTGTSSSPAKEDKSPPTELIGLLLKEWQPKSGWNYELQILDTDLQQLQGVADDKLPPSMSVMFRTLGDQVFIESAGGPSALGLIGRFGVFDQVYRHGRAIAEKEQSLNDSVVFAEIAHLCNLHTANINRRPHFYDYEIPVLTPSVLPDKMQIQLSDLFVCVKEDMVILRSRKLKKTVIPRLSSAFNYTKNDFPVFRFLADLQHQDLQPNFSFSIPALLPGLRFYPRVTYKSCILQLAEWHLHSDELLPCLNSSDAFGSFLTISREAGLSRYFSYSVGDNFLVIDLQKKDDVELFLTETKGKGLVVLKEFPFLCEQMVKTAASQPLMAQYMASLYRDKEVYGRRGMLSKERPSTVCSVVSNDWIYFKVYCHPLSSDRVLTTYLFPVIKKLKKKKYIDGWFWIRYNDPDYHIRIRVKAPHHAKAYVFRLLTATLKKAQDCRLAERFLTDSYKREVERYSAELIEKIEKIFEQSSNLIADWLMSEEEQNYEDEMVFTQAAVSTIMILRAFNLQAPAAFCKQAFDQFFLEFNRPQKLKQEIERLYRRVEGDILCLREGKVNAKEFELLQVSIKEVLQEHTARKVKTVSIEKLATDVIHMHLNRLFIFNQRYFEMVHYYLLYRVESRQQHCSINH